MKKLLGLALLLAPRVLPAKRPRAAASDTALAQRAASCCRAGTPRGMGRDVVADYAVNCFNQHSAAVLFERGARRIVLSVELTAGEIAAVVSPWAGRGFDVVAYARPEGMPI